MLSSIQSPSAAASPASAAAMPAEASELGASAEERLLALIVHSQAGQIDAAKGSVALSYAELAELREQVRDALEAARDAQKDSSFWSDVGDVLGGDLASLAQVVAAAAAIVATGGAAAAVLAAIAVGASLAAKYGEQLGIPPEIALAIGVTAGVASLCLGNPAALNGVSDSVKLAAQSVQSCATATAGGATALGGAAHGAAGQYAADALDHRADARSASSRQELTSLDIDQAIQEFSDAVERQQQALTLTASINQSERASASFVLHHLRETA